MVERRIQDFATAEDALGDDLLLVFSEGETYNMRVKTLKEAVQGDADRAEAAAEKATELAAEAVSSAREARTLFDAVTLKAQDAAQDAAASASAAAESQAAAKFSENASAGSASAAAQSESNAASAASAAADSQTAAANSEAASESSAENALASQQAAKASADNAGAQAEAAAGSAEKAAASEDNAKESEDAAKASKEAAAKSEAAAQASKEAAAKSEAAAKEQAVLAGTRAGTDKTLSIPDAPADAKKVGDELAVRYTKEEVQKLIEDSLAAYREEEYAKITFWVSNDPTSPAEMFGGTWEQIKDKFILAAGDTYAAGSTGGEESVKLVNANIPASWPGIGTSLQYSTALDINVPKWGYYAQAYVVTDDNGRWCTGLYFQIGEQNNTAVNNMPPYITKYVWQRIE